MNQANAFPYVAKFCIGHDANNAPIYDEDSFPGMSLRDYFAAKAMQTFAAEHVHDNSDEIAEKAYRMADAMLLAREQA